MDAADTGIYAGEVGGIDRVVQIGIASGRVISLSFPEVPDEGASRDHELLERLGAYFAGERDEFSDVPVALTVPTDHRAVLDRVTEIPYGETTDVATLARAAPGLDEDEEGVVRAALEANPVPVLIPDHRVRDGPSAAPDDVARHLRSVESDG
jgi:methylated-DNA-[protein]-cysteine S-methyltransferase